MSHLAFKSNQTAALYVADGLREADREAFELHLMNCSDCVEDVETWRALSQGIAAQSAPVAQPVAGVTAPPAPPTAASASAADLRRPASWQRFQAAASLFLACALGLGGGWFLHAGRGPALDDGSVGFVSLAGPTRSADCTVVPLAAGTRIVAARIPGARSGQELIATRLDGQPLDASRYSVRVQADGSWLLRLEATALLGKEVALEARDASVADASEPIGCLAAIGAAQASGR
jgi:hypothetical protein